MTYVKKIGNLFYFLIMLICSYFLLPMIIVISENPMRILKSPAFIVMTTLTVFKISLCFTDKQEKTLKRILTSIFPILHLLDIGFYFNSGWSNSHKVGLLYLIFNGNENAVNIFTFLMSAVLWIALILFFYLCNIEYNISKKINIIITTIMSAIIFILFAVGVLSAFRGGSLELLTVHAVVVYWFIWLLFRICNRREITKSSDITANIR